MRVVDDEFDTLQAEFEASVEQWKKDQKNATREQRREIRKTKPAAGYWDQFIALSEKGNGQAKLWLVAHIRAAGIKSSARVDILTPLYNTLVKEHSSAEWFGDVLTQIAKDKRTIGEDVALGLYETVIKSSESDENRAGALFAAGTQLKKSKDEEAQKRGAAYHARVESEFAETSWGKKVLEKLAIEKVQVGKLAPDFKGKTVDGFEFNLSDYKGKVVMLDFYGFW